MGLFGGGNSSSTNQNETINNDYRQVNTTTNSNTWNDLSDRSVKNYDMSQVDSSSTAITSNSGNTSTNNSINTTNLLDGGAIGAIKDVALGALAGTTKQVMSAYDYGDHLFDSATVFANGALRYSSDAFEAAAAVQTDALNQARGAFNTSSQQIATAYSKATDQQLQAYTSAQQAAQTAQQETAMAYADAKGTTNSQKQIILGVLVVAGIMALGMMQKRA